MCAFHCMESLLKNINIESWLAEHALNCLGAKYTGVCSGCVKCTQKEGGSTAGERGGELDRQLVKRLQSDVNGGIKW